MEQIKINIKNDIKNHESDIRMSTFITVTQVFKAAAQHLGVG